MLHEIGRSSPVGIQHRRGDSLGEQRLGVAQLLGGQPSARMGVHVDEPGGDVKTRRIDHQPCGGARQFTHRHYPVAHDRNRRHNRGVSQPIEHPPTADQHVVLRHGRCRTTDGHGKAREDHRSGFHDTCSDVSGSLPIRLQTPATGIDQAAPPGNAGQRERLPGHTQRLIRAAEANPGYRSTPGEFLPGSAESTRWLCGRSHR